jgi:hypothetical protein
MDRKPFGLSTLISLDERTDIERELQLYFIDMLDSLHSAGSEARELQVYLDRLFHGNRGRSEMRS